MGRNTLGREKRKKGTHSAETMRKAIDMHLAGASLRKAAKEFKIPHVTLRRYVKNSLQNPSLNLESNYAVKKIFTEEQEVSLKDYMLDCSDKFYGLTLKQCRKLAYEMAKINNIEVPLSWERQEMAGRDWLRGFRKRHPEMSLRKPEPCSLARATAFNKENVSRFFNNLQDVMSRHPNFANGNRVYNLDETATTTVQRPQRVMARKGQSVSKITSGERGVLVTTCCIVNALGQAIPPALVFPRKNYKPHMLRGAPPGSLGLATPTGWMNGFLFVDVMKHFIKHVAASKDNPALLIMDNHESHLSIEAVELAKSSGVTILTLHPHTTAKLQPLDVGLNGPFKTFYNAAVDAWLLRNPGKSFTIYEIAECVGEAYLRAMTPLNITSAFKKCGIFPYDENIFTEIDFLPSSVTDRPMPSIDNEGITDAESSTDAEDEIAHANEKEKSPQSINRYSVNNSPSIMDDTSAAALTSTAMTPEKKPRMSLDAPCTSQPPLITTMTPVKKPRMSFDAPSTSRSPLITAMNPAKKPRMSLDAPSTSKQALISPQMFRPPIKAGPRKNTKRRRQAGRSLIATDTPEKDALAAKKKTKTEKNKVKKVKTKTEKNKIKKIKQDLFEKNKKTKKNLPAVPSSSDDEDDVVFQCSGSSSGGEQFVTESDEDEIVLNNNFPPLKQKPRLEDYVIVQFKSKNENIYYIGQILEILEEDDCDYFVSYLKLKSKALQQFIEPVEPDTAGVLIQDIKYILPAPQVRGSSRRQEVITFPVDMSCLNLRY